MTRISNADQVLLLLHEQLARREKKRGKDSVRADAASTATAEPVARLRARAARQGLGEEELKQALVRSLLTQQLGESIANDPSFEAIARDVGRIIDQSEQGRALLDRALTQLNP